MANKTYRICQNCGWVNLNKDYCQQCGEIVNINLKRKLKREQEAKEKIELEKTEKKNRITVFFEEAMENKNLIIRYTALY